MHDTDLGQPDAPPQRSGAPGILPGSAARWVIVVPVKATSRAKTRIVTEPGGLINNAALAAAFAYDTVEAALLSRQVRAVLVVTDDEQIAEGMNGLGARIVREQATLPVGSPGFARLNNAIRHGEQAARTLYQADYVAALTGDLPALRPDELGAVLAEASRYRRTYLADASGAGTSLLAAGPGSSLEPRFGDHSAESHAASGAIAITVEARSVRADIDTLEDLHGAADLGLGPRTTAVFGEYLDRVNQKNAR